MTYPVTQAMNFQIDSADAMAISDLEIRNLLWPVYVGEGHTDPEVAKTLLAPAAVRMRGQMLCARARQNSALAGMVVLVPPTSPARRLAQGNEAELHLLAVKAAYRGLGLGRSLVRAAIDMAQKAGYGKLVLYSQPNMQVAHKLYQTAGFLRAPERDFKSGNTNFRVFEISLKPR